MKVTDIKCVKHPESEVHMNIITGQLTCSGCTQAALNASIGGFGDNDGDTCRIDFAPRVLKISVKYIRRAARYDRLFDLLGSIYEAGQELEAAGELDVKTNRRLRRAYNQANKKVSALHKRCGYVAERVRGTIYSSYNMQGIEVVGRSEENDTPMNCYEAGCYDCGADPCPHRRCNIINHDPVHQHRDGSWWWFNETWAHEEGPYVTKEEADAVLRRYIDEVLIGTDGSCMCVGQETFSDDEIPF